MFISETKDEEKDQQGSERTQVTRDENVQDNESIAGVESDEIAYHLSYGYGIHLHLDSEQEALLTPEIAPQASTESDSVEITTKVEDMKPEKEVITTSEVEIDAVNATTEETVMSKPEGEALSSTEIELIESSSNVTDINVDSVIQQETVSIPAEVEAYSSIESASVESAEQKPETEDQVTTEADAQISTEPETIETIAKVEDIKTESEESLKTEPEADTAVSETKITASSIDIQTSLESETIESAQKVLEEQPEKEDQATPEVETDVGEKQTETTVESIVTTTSASPKGKRIIGNISPF